MRTITQKDKKGLEAAFRVFARELSGQRITADTCETLVARALAEGITIDEESGAVSVVLVPGRGHGRVSLSQLPDVLKVADVDIVGGDITLLGSYAGVRDFVESWNLEADDPRIGRFIAILRRETRGEVNNVEFRSGELLYELTVKTLDFTAPEYVYIEGVYFRNRVLYCYTFVEDMNDILETDSFSILGYPFTGSIKS